MNTNTYNVWICQPLLAANIVEAEDCPWDYRLQMSHDGNNIKISFCPVPWTEVQTEIAAVSVTKAEPGIPEKTNEGGERLKFGYRPDFNNLNFDFEKELSWLPFPVNIGEVEMTESQQKRFIKLIYDNQSVFSLWWRYWPLWLLETHNSHNNGQAHILAPSYNTSSATSWSSQVLGHLAEARYHLTFAKPICIASCHCPSKNWGYTLVCKFQSFECHNNTRFISFTSDWGGLTSCESSSLVHPIWLDPRILTIGYGWGRHP